MVDLEQKILKRLRDLKKQRYGHMKKANKPDGANVAQATELKIRIHELERLINK